jgi:hypothetical protein
VVLSKRVFPLVRHIDLLKLDGLRQLHCGDCCFAGRAAHLVPPPCVDLPRNDYAFHRHVEGRREASISCARRFRHIRAALQSPSFPQASELEPRGWSYGGTGANRHFSSQGLIRAALTTIDYSRSAARASELTHH